MPMPRAASAMRQRNSGCMSSGSSEASWAQIFEQPARPAPGGRRRAGRGIGAEPREQRHVVRPRQHVDAVDLEQARPLEHAPGMRPRWRAHRPPAAETLARRARCGVLPRKKFVRPRRCLAAETARRQAGPASSARLRQRRVHSLFVAAGLPLGLVHGCTRRIVEREHFQRLGFGVDHGRDGEIGVGRGLPDALRIRISLSP